MTLLVAVVAASTAGGAAIQHALDAVADISVVASKTLMNFSVARLRRADVLVLDHELQFEIIRQLVRAVGGPINGPRIIVSGVPRDEERLIQYIEYGLSGYVLDSEPAETLVDVVRTVGSGGVRLDAWLAGPVIEHYRQLREQVRRAERREDDGQAGPY